MHLDIVNVHLPVVTKLERAFAFFLSKGICLIDFGILREFTIRFYLCGSASTCTQKIKLHQLTVASLVRRVFHYDIRLAVLELTQREQDNVTLIDPHLTNQLKSDMIKMNARTIHTFLRIFPRIWASRFSPSKHIASRRPFPSILITCAYSWPSSRNTNSRLSSSFSFFPRLRFLPPCKDTEVQYLAGGEHQLSGEPFPYSARSTLALASESNGCARTHLRHADQRT